MSSTYRRICLSHEPPLVIDEECADCVPPAKPPAHPDCVIGMGRWSRFGGLVEIWLPFPYQRRPEPGETGDPLVHVPGSWVDVSWMRRTGALTTLARAILAEQI